MDAWQYILVYYISISIPSVIITVYDKIAAIKKAVRIPERTLMTFSALGGAAAMYVTMKAIRHKTLHKKIYDRFTGIYYFTYIDYRSFVLLFNNKIVKIW